jgi:hypothetical protein
MPTKESKEDLEKLRLSINKHLEYLVCRNKTLRKKQFIIETIAEKLRMREQELLQKISNLVKEENPSSQVVDLKINKEANLTVLHLN